MNHLDLFSGIGGFSLAAQRVWDKEHNIIAFVEQDKFCQKVLKKHWPLVRIFSDIHDYKPEQTETIDLLTAGVPCQPASRAGMQKGTEDDRWLWPEAHRIVRETHPNWIIFENPNGILTLNDGLEFENILSNLESEGYEVQTFIIPAGSVQALHRRDRVWIIANTNSNGIQGYRNCQSFKQIRQGGAGCQEGLFNEKKFTKGYSAEGESELIGANDGIPDWVHRVKALGNAIVPQVAEVIMRGIKST